MSARESEMEWGANKLRAWRYQGDKWTESRQRGAGVTRRDGRRAEAGVEKEEDVPGNNYRAWFANGDGELERIVDDGWPRLVKVKELETRARTTVKANMTAIDGTPAE